MEILLQKYITSGGVHPETASGDAFLHFIPPNLPQSPTMKCKNTSDT
jgi:hypothetical protein